VNSIEYEAADDGLRVIPLKGLFNVRDLGGYAGAGGRVTWGLIYRSGDLARLPAETGAALEARNIKTIVDFRDDEERRYAPDGEIATVRNRHILSISAGSIINFAGARNVGDAEILMEALYQKLPEAVIPPYRVLFQLLRDKENAPLLFHCSAGKDRTGLAAALILSALGVERETIIADYLLSAECLKGKYDGFIDKNPESEPFMTVRRNFIAAALRTIDEDMGGMDRYLRETLGADIDALRNIYLEPYEGAERRDSSI
jgi:protein-tyrosine phosphatase